MVVSLLIACGVLWNRIDDKDKEIQKDYQAMIAKMNEEEAKNRKVLESVNDNNKDLINVANRLIKSTNAVDTTSDSGDSTATETK